MESVSSLAISSLTCLLNFVLVIAGLLADIIRSTPSAAPTCAVPSQGACCSLRGSPEASEEPQQQPEVSTVKSLTKVFERPERQNVRAVPVDFRTNGY